MQRQIFQIFSFLLTLAIFIHPPSTQGQNIERMCRQLQANCQACQVFKSECLGGGRPTARPTPQPQPQPTPGAGPESPSPSPGGGPVVYECYANGKLCDRSEDCCSKNCKMVKIPLGSPDQYFTQRVCRDKWEIL